jgi:hypothetical protein
MPNSAYNGLCLYRTLFMPNSAYIGLCLYRTLLILDSTYIGLCLYQTLPITVSVEIRFYCYGISFQNLMFLINKPQIASNHFIVTCSPNTILPTICSFTLVKFNFIQKNQLLVNEWYYDIKCDIKCDTKCDNISMSCHHDKIRF